MSPRPAPTRCQMTVRPRRPAITRSVVRQGVIINRIRPTPVPPARRAETTGRPASVGLSICTPDDPPAGTVYTSRRATNLVRLAAVGLGSALILAVLGGLATITLLRWSGL